MATEVLAGRHAVNLGQKLVSTGVLRRIVGTQAARLCSHTYGDSLRAVVLTGSVARDEATLVKERRGWRLLGDAEFLLIFHAHASLPPKVALDFLRQNIENSLSRVGIIGQVNLSAAHPEYLSRLRPHIFAYEVRKCGQVVWGDPEILALIPDFSSLEIPLEDGWCLLSNRMIEQLEAVAGLVPRAKTLPRGLYYRTIKLYLDMATSFLLFVGEYAPSYQERAQRLKTLADAQSGDSGLPFDLRRFCDRVSECTHWKLTGNSLGNSPSPEAEEGDEFAFWEEAVAYARLLWRWELALLTRTAGQAGNRELLERWMKCQPIPRRLRGWLYVLRNQGWSRSWRNWPRWARRAWRASPRYWVYGAAGELFFRLPCLLNSAGEGHQVHFDFEKLRPWLPLLPKSETRQKLESWRSLAKDIAWNYCQFLVETRS